MRAGTTPGRTQGRFQQAGNIMLPDAGAACEPAVRLGLKNSLAVQVHIHSFECKLYYNKKIKNRKYYFG